MKINKNQFEILSYIERECGKKLTQSQIAEGTHLNPELVSKVYMELEELGMFVQKNSRELWITKQGLDVLEPYRVRRAVILAAGFGSRLVPITLNTPKPLVRVHGKMIVETMLDAIIAAGIKEIVLVRGYLWEQFDVLRHRYPEIDFVYNPLFNDANNISSAFLAKDLLSNAYVMEADLLVSNPDIIRKYEYSSNYLGMYKEYTDDWCFDVQSGIIKELNVGGTNCYHMYGVSYWTREDGERLGKSIEAAFKMPGGKEKYWDEVALRVFKNDFNVEVRPCFEGDIVEIDTFKELKQIDPIYAMD
ncbi:MAG: phosphocholine cytidylyltransferase family protein [Eubacteriales bacterium]|nr:phosphocholine cytidylyltransferase family protein [Eubacteriales bacterium]